jgi:heptosyltransferase-2
MQNQNRPVRENGKRILVKIPNYAGDVVTCLPALEAIRYSFPRSEGNEIHLLTDTDLRWLFYQQDCFDNLIAPVWDAHRVSATQVAECLRKSGPYDVGIIFTRQYRFLRGFKKAGIAFLAGFASFLSNTWLDLSVPIPRANNDSQPSSQVQDYLYLVEKVSDALSGHTFPRMLQTKLYVDPESELEIRRSLARSWPAHFYTLVVGSAPTSYGRLKRWPIQNFVSLAMRLHYQMPELVPLFLFGPAEEEIYARFLKACPDELQRRLILIKPGSTHLGHVIAIINATEFVVTNDTGPRHIAVALGKKVVLIFGPVDPKSTAYSSDLEYPVYVNVGCNHRPCKVKRCPDKHICMTAVTPGLVFRAIVKFVYDATQGART